MHIEPNCEYILDTGNSRAYKMIRIELTPLQSEVLGLFSNNAVVSINDISEYVFHTKSYKALDRQRIYTTINRLRKIGFDIRNIDRGKYRLIGNVHIQ